MFDPRIPPNVLRNTKVNDCPDLGGESVGRILGIDSGLDGVAEQLNLGLFYGSGSPAAEEIISSTRSSPVTDSVTGCSTCKRVFISKKK